jgi:hypothetical protein
MLRVDGAPRPRKARDEQNPGAGRTDASRASQMCRTHQKSQTAEPQNEAGDNSWDGPYPTRAEPIEKNHPEGNQSHNQSGNAGRQGPFGQTDTAIAYKKEQQAGDGGGMPLPTGWPNPCLPAQDRIKNQAGGEVAGCGKQKWRKRFDANSDGEIGGTPNHVNSSKRSNQQGSVPPFRIGRPGQKDGVVVWLLDNRSGHCAEPEKGRVEAEQGAVEHHIGRSYPQHPQSAVTGVWYYNQVFDLRTLREFPTG